MGDLIKNSRTVTFSGGNSLGLTQTTILYGKGQNITDIDYDKITINPLVFHYPLVKEKILYDSVNELYNNVIYIDNNAIISPDDVAFNYQKKLIPNSSIIIDNYNNISVDFRLSGWSNINNNYITNNYNNIGIGITNPLANIHIRNNNASIIIDNSYSKFKFNYNDFDYFTFGNFNNIDNIHTEQLKIHKNASFDSLIINENNSIILNSNIHITGTSYLSPDININNTNIINWLSNNGLASYNYVKDNLITTSNTVLKGIGREITELDYNNIIYNKLNFNYPLSNNNNNISIDLNIISDWSNTKSNKFIINSNIGIGTNEPMANLHIGSMNYSVNNMNDNDGSLIISKSLLNLNKNFKFGYDNNFNFILGDYTKTNFTPFISINSNVNINTNLIINSQTISLNRFNIIYNNTNFILGNNLLFINNNGSVGIGTLPNSSYKLIIDGGTKINTNLEVRDIFANNCISCNITLNTLTANNNITSTNINSTNLITSLNLNNSLTITTRTLNSTTINNTNTINTNNINCINTFTTNNINANNSYVSNLLLVPNTINTSILISSNINSINNIITSNINSINTNSTNINSTTINSININANNTITANTIRTSILNSIDTITTATLTARTANLTNLNTTNNITSLNINCTRTITSDNINTTSLTSATINNTTLNTTTINTTTLTSRNFTSTNNISGINLFINNITSYNNIGIGTTQPRGLLHINANKISGTNSSIIITNLNDISIKSGYINNDFVLGTYNINNDNWINQFSINANAPENSININSLGNIGIGTINTRNIYKLDINGTINATNLLKNGEEFPTLTILNQQINNSLIPYLTSTNANTLFTKFNYVDNLISITNNNVYDIVANSFKYHDNIYTSLFRFPTANSLYTINIIQTANNYYSNSIYGFKETFVERQLLEDQSFININYEIYYSSGDKYKNALFNYENDNLLSSINWKENTYNSNGEYDTINNNYSVLSNNFYNFPSSSSMPNNEITQNKNDNYRGEYLIFKISNAFIFQKFRFYITKTDILSAPGNWICCGSIDGINWTYLKEASVLNNNSRLTPGSYNIFNNSMDYYEKSFINYNEYNFIGFMFNTIVNVPNNHGRTLKLTRVELFGRFKINPVYISSTTLTNTLNNYATLSDTNSKLSKDIIFASPLQYSNNIVSLNSDYILMLTSNNDTAQFRAHLSNLINNYINSYTNVWKTDINNPTNYYFNGNCIGIGITNVNPNQITNLKLNVNGTIQTTRINANIFSGNGSEITNINYNNIINIPDLKNLNNWNISTLNNITNCYANFNGNIGIGYVYNSSLTHKFNINGSIFSSANIIATNFIEDNVNISDKYISSNYANLNFFSNSGGIINGSVGIGTSANNYSLNINGNINSTAIFENGINISSKYITFTDTFNYYISKFYGGIINNTLYITSNVGIGTTLVYNNNILSVNGSVYSTSNISASNFIEDNVNISDKYLTINNASQNYFSNIGGTILGSVGINTSISSNFILNVNGSIYSSNDIISSNFIENGLNLIDKYLTLNFVSNNYLSNINPIVDGNIYCSGNITENGILLSNKYLSQDGGNILGNIGIGTSPSSIYKLNVNGDIYCSGNITENGILLSNKYLSQDGGNILGNIGIGTNPSSIYKLNVNGSIYSSNDIISSNFIENGINLIDKYLTINFVSNNYLSNVNPIVDGNIYCSGNISENGILLSNKYLSQNGGNILGNIGIGTNPSSIYKLNVNGSIYSSNNIIGSNLIGSNIICDNIIQNGSNLNDIYVKISDLSNYNNISSNNPNIQKKIGIKFQCTKEIVLNNNTYYLFNINIANYVNTKNDYIDGNPYRIFNIKCFSTNAIFRTNLTNKPPNILQYDIYMSDLINLSPPALNICAIGFPSNYYLNKITAGDIFILKTNNYNYISVLSKYPNANISCIITDFLF